VFAARMREQHAFAWPAVHLRAPKKLR
jgi:hypothetical protein